MGAVVVEALSEGIGPGGGVHEVAAPVALHEAVHARAAGLGQEGLGGAGQQHAVDVIGAQHAFQLLLEQDGLVLPVGGAGLVGDDHGHGEGAACGGQLLNGLGLVFEGLFGVEEVLLSALEGSQGGEVGAVHLHEGGGGDGVLQHGGGVVGLDGAHGVQAVKRAHDGVAEVGVVHGDQPVFGAVFRVVLGVEVEAVEIAVVGDSTVTHHDVGVGGQPLVHHVVAQFGAVHLAALGHNGCQGAGFGVVDAVNAVQVHVVGVPVVDVLHIHMLHLGLELGEDERAAVVHLVAGGGELRAQLLQLRAVGGHEAAVGHAGDEVGGGLGQGVLQGVVVDGLHAHQVEIGDFAVLVFGGVDDVARVGHQVGHAGLIFGGQHILQGGHEVVGGHFRHGVALVVIPLHAAAKVEGPGQLVGGNLPAFGQAGQHLRVAVILHQGVHHVGAHGLIPGRAAGQVVQGGNLAAIEGGVDLLSVCHGGGHAAQQQGQTKNDSNYLLHERTSFF